jgi:large subunit ribosomal protein L23
MNYHAIIKRPVVSEKSTMQKEVANQLSFEVDRKANRIEIKKAIQSLFSVQVDAVRTLQIKGKFKKRGRII